jgi:transposase
VGDKERRQEKRWIEIKKKEELLDLLRKEKDSKVKLRLLSLNLIANYDMDVKKASSASGIPVKTLYVWIAIWNKEGYEGIQGRPPSPGRPSKLDEEDMERLKGYLKEEQLYWTTKEVIHLVKERFGVGLKENRIREILRDRFKMNLSKPYVRDYRRPENAKEILKEGLKTTMGQLKRLGLKKKDIAIGFLDETSPQTTANTVRVWSFGKVKIIKNTTKMRSNTIGFYAINGHSISDSLPSSKAIDISEFLEKIRSANQGYKAIIAVLDNFPSHKSKEVREKAKRYGIYPLFLPPYSPDLNPIEFMWKSIKRAISIKFIKDVGELRDLIRDNFMVFSQSLGYARNWMLEFKKDLSPV